MKWHSNPEKLVIHNKPVVKREYYDNGQLWRESYYLNDKRHNPNGPAYRKWYDNGQLSCEGYFLNNRCYSKPEFDKAIESAKLMP